MTLEQNLADIFNAIIRLEEEKKKNNLEANTEKKYLLVQASSLTGNYELAKHLLYKHKMGDIEQQNFNKSESILNQQLGFSFGAEKPAGYEDKPDKETK